MDKKLETEERVVHNLLAEVELQAHEIAERLDTVLERTSTPYRTYRTGIRSNGG